MFFVFLFSFWLEQTPDCIQKSPLFSAVLAGDEKTVETLLGNGADRTVKDSKVIKETEKQKMKAIAVNWNFNRIVLVQSLFILVIRFGAAFIYHINVFVCSFISLFY